MLSISLNFKQLSKCDIINASKPSIKSSDENEVKCHLLIEKNFIAIFRLLNNPII